MSDQSIGTSDRSKRLRQLLKAGCLIFLCGLFYAVLIRLTGLSLPCPFYLITGLRCPGCGITAMAMALLSGDIGGAFMANEGLFLLSPLIALILIRELWHYVLYGSPSSSRFDKSLTLITILLLILWGIYRNIAGL